MFWLAAWDEALLCFVVCVATFFLWPLLARHFRWSTDGDVLFWTDTIGLAVFAANGALVGATFPRTRLHFVAKALCGMFTATFGGMARDVLTRVPARILHSTLEVYALPALAGGLATTAWLRGAPRRHTEAVLLGVWVTCACRVVAVDRGVRCPTMRRH